ALFPLDFALGTYFIHSWRDGMSTGELLANRMLQLDGHSITVSRVREVVNSARVKSSLEFNRRNAHKLRSEPFKVGEWVLLWDSSLDTQWGRKFDDRYNGPYVIVSVHDGSYSLRELDGREFRSRISGNRLIRY
ncbi:hypothetical protein BCR33DRAFT_639341, partial [Rhizoclosmatium globosum]